MSTQTKAMTGVFQCPLRLLNRRIRVLLVGVGGTGSNIYDALVNLHHGLVAVGHEYGLDVVCMDDDTVSLANIGRQRFVYSDIGQYKSTTLVNRYNLAYGLNWTSVTDRFGIADMSRDFDLLITCVDNIETRRSIGQYLKHQRSRSKQFESDQLWLDFGNSSTDGQVVLGHCYNNACRLPNVYDLYPELDTKQEDNKPSCSLEEAIASQDLYINRTLADAGINLIWQLLRKGKLDHHGAFLNLTTSELKPLKISQQIWEFMGYAA